MTPDRGLAPAYPREVARVLSYLANLIDSSIALRGVGTGVRDFAASFLGVRPTELTATSTHFSGLLSFQLAALGLAEDMDVDVPAAVIGQDTEEPPRWERLDLGDVSIPYPLRLAAAFEARTLVDPPIVISVCEDFHEDGLSFTAYTRAGVAGAGRAYLDSLVARGERRPNPFRGRTLEVAWTPGAGMTFRVASPAPVSREDLVLPKRLWAELDRNVHGLFAAVDRLRTAGLGTNRGVLLAGPPGTGKTALCRALSGELEGTTVVFCDANAIQHTVGALYRELVHVTPALVVMEDLDLVVEDRHRARSSALQDFLLALDGAVSRHEGVVTIATTNDPDAIDAAAKRAARFDCILDVPRPDRAGRAAIMARYLRNLEHSVDVDAVAAATAERTGADLRELVGRAVLSVAEAERRGEACALTTDLVLRLAREGADPEGGPYL